MVGKSVIKKKTNDELFNTMCKPWSASNAWDAFQELTKRGVEGQSTLIRFVKEGKTGGWWRGKALEYIGEYNYGDNVKLKEDAVKALVFILGPEHEKDGKIRKFAPGALSKLDTGDIDPELREKVVHELKESLADTGGGPIAYGGGADAKMRVCTEAAKALAEMGEKDAIQDMLKSGVIVGVSGAKEVINSVQKLLGKETIPTFIRIAEKSESLGGKEEATYALGVLDYGEVGPAQRGEAKKALITALSDPEPTIRKTASMALAMGKFIGAVEKLEGAYKKETDEVTKRHMRRFLTDLKADRKKMLKQKPEKSTQPKR